MDDKLDLGEPVLIDFTRHPIWVGGAKAARRDLLDELEREVVKMQQPLIDRAKTSDILRRYCQHGEFDAYERILAIIRKHREDA